MRQALRLTATVFLRQQGFLFPWSPVCLAIGIAVFFALRFEPPVAALSVVSASGVLCFALSRVAPYWAAPFITAVALTAFGFSLAGARTHMVAGPVLDFRYYGAIEGRIVAQDRSASDAIRLTLDRVVLERMDPAETPRRVRVSLHGSQGYAVLGPGATVILTGHLSAPGGAVEPGGFDFRRHAWFLRLGAVGYTRTPVLLLEPPGSGQWIFKTRMAISSYVQSALPGPSGAFAAAVTTGDRSGMDRAILQDLRDTNLAHLLAISGLHMGLLAGFVFGGLRLAIVLLPWSRHRWRAKPVAAGGALIAAFFYLLLSGGNVATERAFIMAAVALTAVMLSRRALSLRAVALAALIVLVWQPEALLSPGFQMSFAATTALVAVFEWLNTSRVTRDWPRAVQLFIPLLVSSAVAGLATAPVGMAHFNQSASYGLIANLISVSAMGILVVPCAVLAGLLFPFGLDWVAFWFMELGLSWILTVATTIADWPGAVRPIVAPGPGVLPAIALGGLVLCLWRGKSRLVGLLPMAAAGLVWMGAERPAVLIADSGGLVGAMSDAGRGLSREKGSGFIASVWLENDGQRMDQATAAALWPAQPIDGYEVLHLHGKRIVAGFAACSATQIVIANHPVLADGPCLRFDPGTLAKSGSVALYAGPDGPRIVTDRAVSGDRIWHDRADDRASQ